MGAFKPLLPFGDRTVIECCIDSLRGAEIDEIVCVVGHRAEDIRAQLRNSQVSFAVNPDPDSEMSASIALGVKQVSRNARALLLALVDHPAVPSERRAGSFSPLAERATPFHLSAFLLATFTIHRAHTSTEKSKPA